MTSVLLNEIYQSDIRNVTNLDIDWNRLQGKTLLITGATGMIASALIDILMCKNKNIQGRDGIHIIGTITANVEGTHQLLEYAAGHMCERFFFFSSVEIYGENRKDTEQFDENYLGYIDCNTVRAGYPESKRLGETLCNAYATQKGQDFVIGRFSRAYGPTMQERDSKAIAQFIKKAVAGEDIVLKSEGTQVYSYTYVVDAAAAILYLLLYAKSGDAINIADRKSDISLREIARILAEIAHTNVIFEQPDELERKGYSTATRATLNPERMENMGWVAKTDIREGLKKTVECLKN